MSLSNRIGRWLARVAYRMQEPGEKPHPTIEAYRLVALAAEAADVDEARESVAARVRELDENVVPYVAIVLATDFGQSLVPPPVARAWASRRIGHLEQWEIFDGILRASGFEG